jgi:cell wall-associated NlpC family hydrolase
VKRVFAVAIAVASIIATSAPATADPGIWPGTRQQAINLVIARALSQRGVPYSYGGGNMLGASLGSGSPSTADTVQALGSNTATTGSLPGLTLPTVPGTPPIVVPPAPAVSVVGFDSSGLIVFAFGGVGIKMPRSSGEQYKVGRKILPSQALPGDLIFYGPEGTQSVALFTGNGQMVEGTVPAVTVSPVRTNGMTPYLTRVIDR